MALELVSIKVRKIDLERMLKLKVHETQPRWSIFKDLLERDGVRRDD